MIDLADVFGAMLMPTNRAKAWLRDRFFSAARLLPGARNYVLQMRFKPMPRYDEGLVVKAPGTPMVGRMLIQPDVEDVSGARRKLDDVLGPWFAVVGWQTDPQAALGDADRAFWRALGARFFRIDRARCGSGPGSRRCCDHDTTCIEDVDNTFSDWIDAHPGSVLVLRPDRYIAAQCSPDELPEVTRRFATFTREASSDERLAA
jgi:3-(3-hydroxy-phenyl)propionate hydroxylase